MKISLIAAVSTNGVIGKDGDLPWRLPADLRWFQSKTKGHFVLMGRRTWESIGRALPGRQNIVATRQTGFRADGCDVVASTDAAIDAAGDAEGVMIIGGGEIYRQFLPLADRIYMTRVKVDLQGDADFPPLDEGEWTVAAKEDYDADESNEYAVRWRRNRLGDLGFPEREQAMRAYAPLSTHALPAVDPEGASEGTPIAIGLGRAAARIEENLLGQTLAELSPERGNDVMNSILAVANSIAVADRLPLTEDATAERSLAKAVRGIERGLAEISRTQNRPLGAVLDKTPPLDLFRIGATLDASLRQRDPCEASFVRDEEEDWNVETEMIAEEDEVVANLSVRRGSQDTD